MSVTRILTISERYWPEDGGGELATHLILNMLRKRFEVTVVTGTKSPSKLPGVRYVYEPLLSKREKPILWLNTLRLVHTQRLKKLLRESDVVYIPRFAFPLIPYAKRLGKRVVVHLHGYIPISYTATVLAPYEEHKHRIAIDDIGLECMKSIKHCVGVSLLWWLPKLARKWISQADKILCVSRRHAEIIADQMPELKDKIEVVYNPLPPEIINITPRKELDDISTFLYVGGDSYIKGFHILLQTLNKLGKHEIKARFILAGGYGSKSLGTLEQLSNKYGNLEIQVLGRVKYSKLLKLHEDAWGILFPSISEEPLPYAIIESLLMGTIPIASKAGGIPEIIKGTPAEDFPFTPGDIDELINKIKMVMSQSREEIISIGIRLKEHATKLFDSKEINSKILRVFNSD